MFNNLLTNISPGILQATLLNQWKNKTYTERINYFFRNSLIAHWPLSEVSGSIASCNGRTPIANMNPDKSIEAYEQVWAGNANCIVERTTNSEEKHSGNYGIKVTRTGTNGICTKQVSVIPGEKYRFKFWIRGDGINAANYTVGRGDGGAYLIGLTGTSVTGTTFVEITSNEFTAPLGYYVVNLSFWAPNVEGAYFFFDDVELVPSSLSSNVMFGVYYNATLNQPGFRDSENSVYFDGSNGSGIPISMAIANNMPTTKEGTMLSWYKPKLESLTDGKIRSIYKFKSTGTSAEANYVDLWKDDGINNKIGFQFKIGDMVAEAGGTHTLSEEKWECHILTWHPERGLKEYVNGIQLGESVPISDSDSKIYQGFINAIGCIDRNHAAGAWHGWLSHHAIGDVALSDDDIFYLGQPL